MSFNFTCAPRTIFGEKALKTAAPYIADFGKKALIVTGKIITKTGLAAKVQDVLSVRGISSVIFNDLPGEPDDKMINAALSVFKSEKCDFIIGLGGGTLLIRQRLLQQWLSFRENFLTLQERKCPGILRRLFLFLRRQEQEVRQRNFLSTLTLQPMQNF